MIHIVNTETCVLCSLKCFPCGLTLCLYCIENTCGSISMVYHVTNTHKKTSSLWLVFIYFSLSISIYISIYLSIYLSICLSIYRYHTHTQTLSLTHTQHIHNNTHSNLPLLALYFLCMYVCMYVCM